MITIDDVATEYQLARLRGWPKAAERMHRLLIKGLSPKLLTTWQRLPLDEKHARSSEYFADYLNIKVNHAGNLLIRLKELGLAQRKPIINDEGLHYVWWCVHLGMDIDIAEDIVIPADTLKMKATAEDLE